MAGLSGNNRLPKDAQVIVSMLKEAGINDYEPRVVNQLLEFTYRYVTGILDEARVYAQHSKKKIVDLDDVKLASMMQLDRSFTTPPPRDMLMEVAKTRNSCALPVIKPHYGLRLPPDRHCLSACNYKLRTHKKPMVVQNKSSMMSSSLLSSSNRMTSNLGSQRNPINVKMSGTSSGGMTMVSTLQSAQPLRTKVIPSNKPVIKFNTPGASSALPKIQISTGVSSSSSMQSATPSQLVAQSLSSMNENEGVLKRKREPDDTGFETVE